MRTGIVVAIAALIAGLVLVLWLLARREQRGDEAPQGTGREDVAEPPQWSPFAGDGTQRVVALVEQYFARRGRKVRVDDGAFVLDGSSYGLENLARICAAEPEAAWPERIESHFQSVLASSAEVAQHMAWTEVEPRLRLRLFPADMAGIAAAIGRDDVPGLRTTVVVDLPNSVRSVIQDDVTRWERPPKELLERASANTRGESVAARRVQGEGAALIALEGDSYYVASQALFLERYPDALGREGTVFAVPGRHHLFAYPVEDLSVVAAISLMGRLARTMFDSLPGAISDQLYWRRKDGRIEHLPMQRTESGVAFRPPASFLEVLNGLAGQTRAEGSEGGSGR